MPSWTDGYLTANNLKIHYYRTSGDKPPVVINHGAGDDGLCFTHIVKQLEGDYDVIMPDARGHGKSGSGKGDYSVSQRVEDLAGLVRSLRLDRPVVGGHSLGAETSMHLAANYPDLVRAIFLEDPPIFLPGEKFDLPGDQSGKPIQPQDIGKMMAKYMRMMKIMPKFIDERMARKASPTYPDDEIEPWIDSKKRVSFDFLNSLASLPLHASDPFGVIEAISVPTLLFIGDREKMAIVSVDCAEQAAQVNPLVQVVHLAGASHDIRRTRSDGYLPALKKFLGDIYSS
jgi:N-formylmaleamate deformylase